MTPPRELRVGDRVRDCDPRMDGRERTVLELATKRKPIVIRGRFCKVLVDAAVLGHPGKSSGRTTVRLNRIHTDGKPRRSGWSLVTS